MDSSFTCPHDSNLIRVKLGAYGLLSKVNSSECDIKAPFKSWGPTRVGPFFYEVKMLSKKDIQSRQMVFDAIDKLESGLITFNEFEQVYFSVISSVEDIELRQMLYDEYRRLNQTDSD